MSTLRQASGEDYPDAARKHFLDAQALMRRRRHDGAAYLAGYSVECVLKTIIQISRSTSHPVLKHGHNLNDLSEEALRLASLPSSKTARYSPPSGSFTCLPYDNPPAGWKETLRYHYEGTISKAIASTWLSEAERLYKRVLWRMMKDGEVTL